MNKQQALEAMAEDILYFGRTIVPEMFEVASPDFHFELCDLIQDPDKNRLNIIAPRDHAKSSIMVCLGVLWHIFLEDFYHGRERKPKFVVIVSETHDEAKRRLRMIKDVLNYSEPFRAFFGNWGQVGAELWNLDQIRLKDGSTVIAKGTGQQVRGLKEGHVRPSCVVLDDPESENNTKTPEAMEGNLEYLLNSLEPSVAVPHGQCWVIGTPQKDGCMVLTLKDMKGWATRHYKALNQKDEGDEVLKHLGDEERWEDALEERLYALWPERYPVERLLEMREQMASINRVHYWYKERQCEIIAAETALFKEHYLRYYDGHVEIKNGRHFLHLEAIKDAKKNDLEKIHGEKIIPVTVFMGIDPQTSRDANADYFVILAVAVDAEKNIYVLPFYRGRPGPSGAIEQMKANIERWQPLNVAIETTAAQETFRDILRNLDDFFIPGLHEKHNPQEKKDKRYLEILEPYFYRGKVYLQEHMIDLVSELLSFPGKHDDILDGLYYAVLRAYPPHHSSKSYEDDYRKNDSEYDWKLA